MKIIIYTNNTVNEKTHLDNFIEGKNKEQKNLQVEKISNKSTAELKSKADFYYKSLYGIMPGTKNYNDHSWVKPGYLLGHNKLRKPLPRQDTGQVLTVSRSGTVFLEKILQNFYKNVKSHITIAPNSDFSKDTEDVILKNINEKADVFILYREDFGSFASSYAIARTVGFHHETNYDFSAVTLPKNDNSQALIECAKLTKNYFNTTCNFIIAHPNINFFVVKFEDIIKNHSLDIQHQPVNYGRPKESLFEDWQDFEDNYKKIVPIINEYRTNWIKKMQELEIPIVKNFKQFDKTLK